MTRTVAVVTTGRADVSILRPVVAAIEAHPRLSTLLVVGGGHLAHHRGGSTTWASMGVPDDRVERADFLLAADDPLSIVTSMGLATIRHGEIYDRRRPDLVLVTGDRSEMHGAAVAAVPLGIPLAHLHGGELSYGAMDDAFRHSLSKLAALHFASTEQHARRLRQLGAEDDLVHVTGAPALDLMRRVEPMAPAVLAERTGLAEDQLASALLMTFHPVTREGQALAQLEEVIAAVDRTRRPVLVTAPNADAEGVAIRHRLEAWQATDPERVSLVDELGAEAYFSLLARVAAMVGNSSSGIIEAASFRLPTVNVGTRQDGRTRAANVLDAPADRDEIAEALRIATSDEFRTGLAGLANPYDGGDAGSTIANVLATVDLARLRRPRFVDREAPT